MRVQGSKCSPWSGRRYLFCQGSISYGCPVTWVELGRASLSRGTERDPFFTWTTLLSCSYPSLISHYIILCASYCAIGYCSRRAATTRSHAITFTVPRHIGSFTSHIKGGNSSLRSFSQQKQKQKAGNWRCGAAQYRMSLLERVTSFESFYPERERQLSVSGSLRNRKLSFSPLPDSWDPPVLDTVQPIGAFEVPRIRRIRECFHSFCLPRPRLLEAPDLYNRTLNSTEFSSQ